MANFPLREPEIARLAHDVSSGLTANKDTFPSPPVAPEEIDKALVAYNSAREAAITAAAGAVPCTAPAAAVMAASRALLYATRALSISSGATGGDGNVSLFAVRPLETSWASRAISGSRRGKFAICFGSFHRLR